MKIRLRSVTASAAALLLALMLTACDADGGQSLIHTTEPDPNSSTPAESTSDTAAPEQTSDTAAPDTAPDTTPAPATDTTPNSDTSVPPQPPVTTTAEPVTTEPSPDTAPPDSGWTDYY